MNFLSVLGQAMEYDYGQYETLNGAGGVSTADTTVAAAAMIGIIIFALIGALIGYVINSFLLGRIFKKAGVEQWKAWVPFYNAWIMFELGDQKGWMALLLLVPVVNIVAVVFYYIASYNIGLKLGKEGVFVLLAIFLPVVWLAWLAFDKSTWKGAVPAVATVGDAPQQTTTPEETKPPVPPATPPTVS